MPTEELPTYEECEKIDAIDYAGPSAPPADEPPIYEKDEEL